MDIREMALAELKHAEYNPRKDLAPGDPEYEKLKRSLETFGYVDPIIWNQRTERVVGGHQRLKVLLDMGVRQEKVVIVDLAEADERALNIALNKISGDWDMPRLKDLLEHLDSGLYDVSLTGFDMAEIEDIMTKYGATPDEADDDFDEQAALDEIGDEPFTEMGDLYIIGKHRLICGDATDTGTVESLMDGHLANLAVTDPPYNVDYVGKTKDALKIQNDKMGNMEFYEFLLATFLNITHVLKDGGVVYVFHADTEGLNFRTAYQESGLTLKQCLIWVKNVFVMGRQDYQWKHEPVLYGWKEGAAHYFINDRTQTTVAEDNPPDIDKMSKKELLEFTRGILEAREEYETVIHHDRPSRSAEHPTMKPVSLVGRLVNNSSKVGWIVLDLFGGSGSTLMACEQLKRRCFMMELDPKYCDVIIIRYINWCREHKKEPDVKLFRNGEETPCPLISEIRE